MDDRWYLEEFGSLYKVSSKDAAAMKELFLKHNLDADKVWGNYECILRRYESAAMVSFSGAEEEKFITPSLKYFIHPKRTPSSEFPLWVYAAYPDVMMWYDLRIDGRQISMEVNQESVSKFLEELVNSYKSITNKELETC